MKLSFFYLSIILAISSCSISEEDLEGTWRCVENCGRKNTLTFSQDSLEINQYLGYMRKKEDSFFKFHVSGDTLYIRNSSDKLNYQKFPFRLKEDSLCFINEKSVYVKSMKSRIDIFNCFVPYKFFNFRPAVIIEKHPSKKKYLNSFPEFLLFKPHKGKPVLIYNYHVYPINKVKQVLDEYTYNLSEEEIYSRNFNIIFDKKILMKDVDSILKITNNTCAQHAKLLYNTSYDVHIPPDKWIVIPMPPPSFPVDYFIKQRFVFNDVQVRDSKLKKFLTNKKNEIIRIVLKKGAIYFNNESCFDLNDLKQKYKRSYSFESNPSEFIEIDSAFLSVFDKFLSGSFSEESDPFIESHKKDNEVRWAILKYISNYQTLNYNSGFKIVVEKTTSFQEWLQVYTLIQETHDEVRSKICRDLFRKDYYKLEETNSSDLEILRMVRSILPFRCFQHYELM